MRVPLPLRRWNRAVHRDLGYLCAGLTLLYGLTGILLNHLHDWKPAYRIQRVSHRLPLPPSGAFAESDVPAVLTALGETATPTGTFREDQERLKLFLGEGRMLTLHLRSGLVEGEVARRRPVVAFLNDLHLNRGGRAWTWLTDLYALLLSVLAVTGLFVLRGRTGPGGRGWKLVLAGIVIPLLALLLQRPR
jgi:hypothetical protein